MEKTIYCTEYNTLIEWLRMERKKRKISMRVLAKYLNVHHSWIGRIETGERRLDIIEYIKYCNALNINPHEGITLINSKKMTPCQRVKSKRIRGISKHAHLKQNSVPG